LDRRFIPLFLIVFIDLVGFGIVIPVLLLHAEESFGATDLQATGLLTAYSAGLVLAGPVLGRLSDAYGRRIVLLLSQVGASSCSTSAELLMAYPGGISPLPRPMSTTLQPKIIAHVDLG
jgi:MFS family permease